MGDLGSGSDYTVFFQHLGVPSTDIGSTGSYGVYHSAFDDFQWFKQFGDPNFLYEQQMARLFGLETLRMANADVLPYDYKAYGEEVSAYLSAAEKKSASLFTTQGPDFTAAEKSASDFEHAGAQMLSEQNSQQANATANIAALNKALLQTERALLIPEGLPRRPWYHHAIYAPGMHTGYAAVVISGVNEAIERQDAAEAQGELNALTSALERAAHVLEAH